MCDSWMRRMWTVAMAARSRPLTMMGRRRKSATVRKPIRQLSTAYCGSGHHRWHTDDDVCGDGSAHDVEFSAHAVSTWHVNCKDTRIVTACCDVLELLR